ncbi:RimK family alpha-L-glutamate ligase [Streptomyces sp. NPDC056053]|uniref:ATP-grasp domain-containing protein n=1 Tax=Streptomyces sp. NPDC056053 TaxID=3345696 RepID=UPI0035DDD87B
MDFHPAAPSAAGASSMALSPDCDPVRAFLIGDAEDPHVSTVLARLPKQGTVVIDAATLPSTIYRLSPREGTFIDLAGEQVRLSPEVTARGWIRRLAPAGWDAGTVLGSRAAARLAARMTVLAALLRDARILWMCGVDTLFAAENKIVQYRAAQMAGLRVPETFVCADPEYLAAELGEAFVIKPLGPGNFTLDDGPDQVVHTRAVTAQDLAEVDLLGAPFLAQKLLIARTHLRIVTVDGHAWTAELDARGLPLDWRQAARAHRSFVPSSRWDSVERDAVRLAEHLQTSFTCQDWIVDDAGPAFVDLNPGGQWLFLPDSMTSQIADSLANWLRGT